jgi:hypothetical protein
VTNTQESLYDLTEQMKRDTPLTLELLTAKDDAQLEAAFDAILEQAVERLEADKAGLIQLNEDILSSFLANALWRDGVEVWREAHTNGHVDLTIVISNFPRKRKKLGEAKIYDGPAYHISGLQQLLGRYTTGRESRGLVIAYVKKRGIAQLINKIREEMDANLPHAQQGVTCDHGLKWSFLSTHAHSCGENLEVSHIGCNLYTE